MAARKPEPERLIKDVSLVDLVGRIVARLSAQTGEPDYLAARDLKAAVDSWLYRQVLLDIVLGRPWKEIGEKLGISAQAAHRKYRNKGDF